MTLSSSGVLCSRLSLQVCSSNFIRLEQPGLDEVSSPQVVRPSCSEMCAAGTPQCAPQCYQNYLPMVRRDDRTAVIRPWCPHRKADGEEFGRAGEHLMQLANIWNYLFSTK